MKLLSIIAACCAAVPFLPSAGGFCSNFTEITTGSGSSWECRTSTGATGFPRCRYTLANFDQSLCEFQDKCVGYTTTPTHVFLEFNDEAPLCCPGTGGEKFAGGGSDPSLWTGCPVASELPSNPGHTCHIRQCNGVCGDVAETGTCSTYVPVQNDLNQDGYCLNANDETFSRCWYAGSGNWAAALATCHSDENCVGYSEQNEGGGTSSLHFKCDVGDSTNCPATSGTAFADDNASGCPSKVNTAISNMKCFKKQCADATCGAGGDPHFMLFGGKRYNYQGECDLVLVSTKTFQGGQNLDVHVRTKIESVYSIITAIAIMVGTLVFEFNHETAGAPKYLVNGQPVELPFEQDQFKVTTHELYNEDFNKMVQMIMVVVGTDATLHISIMDQWVHVNMDAKNIFDSIGLAGSFPKGEMLGRDGTNLSHDRIAFGSQWQVQLDEPQLFHSVPDGHPQAPFATCKLPDQDAHQYLRTRSSALYNMAVEACKMEGISGLDLEDCVFDVAVMNNPKIAAAWWAMEKEE